MLLTSLQVFDKVCTSERRNEKPQLLRRQPPDVGDALLQNKHFSPAVLMRALTFLFFAHPRSAHLTIQPCSSSLCHQRAVKEAWKISACSLQNYVLVKFPCFMGWIEEFKVISSFPFLFLASNSSLGLVCRHLFVPGFFALGGGGVGIMRW